MKFLLVTCCALFISYGCSEDSPTAPAAPALDMTSKSLLSGVYEIKAWDDEVGWATNGDSLLITRTWRFTKYSGTNNEFYVDGAYTLYYKNSTDYQVEIRISGLTFKDKDGIIIAEPPIIPTVNLSVSAYQSNAFTGTFKISPGNIDAANSITEMRVKGNVFKSR